jgi:hypothetical protein
MRAATDIDRELDTALVCLGILPPLDLSIIRSWLTLDDVELRAAQNPDGHRIVEVMLGHRPAARIHHDGHVVVTSDRTLTTA